ncbi:hypothetical protein MUO71_02525, partial [Candidatus Bathyarchaeota archaeon]|nr:hypothetical protein [Candidatus Bathyarchaeota archaeon]
LKQTAEEMKNELFFKRFSKPKPEDIHVVSVDKHYEPYVLVDAKYRIDYYTKKVYTFEVTEKAKEIKILGETFKPQMVPIPDSVPEQFRKVVSLEGNELSVYEDKTYFILDRSGREISPDQVPIAPSEDNPRKILKEFGKNAEKVTISNRDVISLAKTKIINRPVDVDTVEDEMFQVNEYAVIYNPVYRITFRNIKSQEEKTVSIDGVTAEIIK